MQRLRSSRNSKNQSAFCDHIWCHVSCIQIKELKYFPAHLVHYNKIKEHTRVVKIDKKRLKVALAVLNVVRSTFPETSEFIDNTLKEKCEKENITADEVIFLQV